MYAVVLRAQHVVLQLYFFVIVKHTPRHRKKGFQTQLYSIIKLNVEVFLDLHDLK